MVKCKLRLELNIGTFYFPYFLNNFVFKISCKFCRILVGWELSLRWFCIHIDFLSQLQPEATAASGRSAQTLYLPVGAPEKKFSAHKNVSKWLSLLPFATPCINACMTNIRWNSVSGHLQQEAVDFKAMSALS